MDFFTAIHSNTFLKKEPTGETYRASSSSTLKLCGSLQTAVLLPVNPTGGAQSALHVWGTPGVPLRRLSRWVGDKRFSELAPVSVRSRCLNEHLPIIHGSSVIAGNQNIQEVGGIREKEMNLHLF